MRRHVTSTFGFKYLGHHLQAVGAVGKALQVEVKQRVVEAEAIIGVAIEGCQRRAQGHFRGDATAGRRGPEQVHRGDFGHHLVRWNPAQHRGVMQAEADLHTVRLEIANLEADAAQVCAGLLLADQLQGGGVIPGGGGLAAGEIKGFKAAGGQLQRLANHFQAAWVGDLQFHRQALQGAFPVAAAYDHAQVRGFTGPVQATVGEQVGAETIDRTVLFQAADIEAR